MLNALGNVDNGSLLSKYPIGSRNPPDLKRADPLNLRSILSQNEFASSIIPVPTVT